jgi:hypothetical protein
LRYDSGKRAVAAPNTTPRTILSKVDAKEEVEVDQNLMQQIFQGNKETRKGLARLESRSAAQLNSLDRRVQAMAEFSVLSNKHIELLMQQHNYLYNTLAEIGDAFVEHARVLDDLLKRTKVEAKSRLKDVGLCG